MQIIQATTENLNLMLKEAFASGKLVVYPTETCYGVGVDAANSQAVSKLLAFKERPEGKAISIAVGNVTKAEEYVELNDEAKSIYKRLLPGPVTVISKSKGNVDKRLESEIGTLGVRIPKYDLMLNFLQTYEHPITATSANAAGKKTPYSVKDILENNSQAKLELIDLVIDAGELPHNPPSTVIDTTLEDVVVYRQGSVKFGDVVRKKESRGEQETIEIGKEVMQLFKGILDSKTVIILLNGSIGAGKTYFTKGLAQELGITSTIKSPSYTYVLEYDHAYAGFLAKLYHFDAWRVNSQEDLEAIVEPIWFKAGNVVVIEWPGKVLDILNKHLETISGIHVVQVDINYKSDSSREITVYSK